MICAGNLKEGIVFEGPGLDLKKTLHLTLNEMEVCGLYSSAQDRNRRAVVNMVMNLSVSQTAGSFLTLFRGANWLLLFQL